ncbi:hypothetical protein J1G42_10165 [Cellulomonas sp. zg-ZUI222]|uniref:hypothetical protein n=1 Tax=Cellulomonas TaxID=1707 RepID=UPI001A9477A4|nr:MULTISPECIES: hypothetical protein [Cellulomonas]MBO0899899.1 hypothetical protein [Cellulomonas sp. zg-ZUI22]MBO0921187.1 hypothetical protein [Cellulomonas wangleii]
MTRGDEAAAAGRWERLFADLEAQLAAGNAADARWDVAELTRAERARVGLADRLRASTGRHLRVVTTDAGTFEGEVVDAAAQWLLLALGTGRTALVVVAALGAVEGLGPHVAPPAGRSESALGLGHALRALARDRATVTVHVRGAVLAGRLERVGADHLDLMPATGPARAVCVPFSVLQAVVSR